MAEKGRNKPRKASKNVTDKREARKKLKKAEAEFMSTNIGFMYSITKDSIKRAKQKGEDKTNPEGFARMVKELERMDSAIKDKEDAERVLKKFEGNTGGLVSKNYANPVTIVDNRRNK